MEGLGLSPDKGVAVFGPASTNHHTNCATTTNNLRVSKHRPVKKQRCPSPKETSSRNGVCVMMNLQEKFIDNDQIEGMFHVRYPEAELTRDYGRNSLAFFGLAQENAHFLTSDGAGLVNYRLMGNVAMVLGDPVCTPEACEQVTQSFLEFCARQHWHAAFYQASSEYLRAYRTLRLHMFKMGEEALLHPQSFALHGSAMANVRTSSRHAERNGVRIEWYDGVPSVEAMQHLEHISHAWLEHKAGFHAHETGFSTGKLSEVIATAERAEAIAATFSIAQGSSRSVPRFVTAVARTNAGNACAFVTFTPIYGSLTTELTTSSFHSEMRDWGWSLDLMRRAPDAPPCVMELLLVQAMERFRTSGLQVVSLGMAAIVDTNQEMGPVERLLIKFAIDRLHLLEDRSTLFTFKQKFHPCWQSRYLVTNTILALPKVALAVLRLRNYSKGGLTRLVHSTDKQ